MGRKIDVEDLVGAAEIADRLELSFPQVVHTWRRRYDTFPDPVADLSSGMVWVWQDIERWLRSTGRLEELTSTPE